MRQTLHAHHFRLFLAALTASAAIFFLGGDGRAETYGITSESGEFQPKITVEVAAKEVVITKLDPQEKFRSLSVQVNPRNSALMHNVSRLKIEWMDAQRHAGRRLPFTGPRYDPKTLTFEDSMLKSVSLKIINTSARRLFEGKALADLFVIKISGSPIVSEESAMEQTQTVQMGKGKDVSITVDKDAVVFTENNVKVGEILNVDNRSGKEQVLGVELPKQGWLYDKIRRRDQTDVPTDDWDRFPVPAGSGLFIVLIPDPDPAQLAKLDGKEIIVKVYDGNTVREVRKIPIKVSVELRRPNYLSPAGTESTGPPSSGAPPKQTKEPRIGTGTARSSGSPGLWIWVLQVVNLVLVLGLAVYGLLFLLPRLQVLDDRLARNEMFIHGSREAIREELEQIKEEILTECQQDTDTK